MIKNIVFDMGNVIVRFDPPTFLDRTGVSSADKELLMREVFLSTDWIRLDRGTLTDAEAEERMFRRIPERLHDAVRMLVEAWDDPILPVPGMYELVEELKSMGYGIYLLSNACLRQPEYWKRVPAGRFFDGTLISANVKLIKPQPEIYRLLCEKFSLVPEECFFVDDSPVNAEGASYCGMQSAVFHNDADELRQRLIEAGVPVKGKQL